ncbi:Serine/threonine-protein kinase 32A [Folsomia candida]|uniref:Serine/threonine-protein kinase 32A n=1 Tax=Folsomia candida TaxID=158441 RepID=A0A226DJB9_FOLCA|nr:Serine/threonine-protein kinase 32A [Folsomia candida]
MTLLSDRDIKPDNILLDEQGHSHIADFNVATKLEEGKKFATAQTPEIFACSVDETPGYDFAVDWWSLGIVAYELAAGRRPYEIHSHYSNKDIRLVHLTATPKWPSAWPPEFTQLLLEVDALERVRCLQSLQNQPIMRDVCFDAVLEMKTNPVFVPPKGHLNCDPTFELEEMIVESRPLHKKKKRLAKQRSLREIQSSPSCEQEFTLDPLAEEFTTFNRQRQLDRMERERKEQEWESELLTAMEASGSASLAASTSTSTSTPKLSEDPADHGDDDADGPGPGPSSSMANHPRSSADSKKSAWAKRRSITMPEGDKVWRVSKQNKQ